MGKEFGLHLEDDGEPWRVLSRGVVQIDLYLRKVVLAAVWSGGGQRRASKWRVLQHLGEQSITGDWSRVVGADLDRSG